MDDLIKSQELEFRPIKNFIECIRRSVTEINDFMLYRLTTVSEFGAEEEACKVLPKYPKGFIRATSVGDKCLFCGCTEWVYVTSFQTMLLEKRSFKYFIYIKSSINKIWLDIYIE